MWADTTSGRARIPTERNRPPRAEGTDDDEFVGPTLQGALDVSDPKAEQSSESNANSVEGVPVSRGSKGERVKMLMVSAQERERTKLRS